MPQVKQPKRPRLTNRGPAGLLVSLPKKEGEVKQVQEDWRSSKPKDRIADTFVKAKLVVSVDSVALDPNNARLHPDRNLSAIMDSLALYGQLKPLVVRKQDKMVAAGNGTLEAAKMLGWTKIAAAFIEMTDEEFIGYALADNRTAELAKWDFEVVARLDKLLKDAQLPNIGWTIDELEVLRGADWTPPAVEEGNGFSGGGGSGDGKDKPTLINLSIDQRELLDRVVCLMRDDAVAEDKDTSDFTDEFCIGVLCNEWLERRG